MISIVIPSVRDYRWKDVLEEFSDRTKADFEIIVCGPCLPQNLGPNFRAIQTNVKTAQCAEIAVRQSKGEYLFITGDDEDHTPGMLDIFLEYRQNCEDDFVILSPTFTQIGYPFPPEAMTYNGIGTPAVACGIFISRKDWDAIGGVDKNFIRGYWELDIAMRCYALGGKIVVFPDLFLDEIIPTLRPVWLSSSNASYHQDRPYLLSLWTTHPTLVDGKLNVARSKPFEPFIDEGIMEADQGAHEFVKGYNQGYDEMFDQFIKSGKAVNDWEGNKPGYQGRA